MRALEPVSLKLRIPADAGRAHFLRRHLRMWLEDAGASSDEIFEVVTAASEAFVNAVEHAQNPSRPEIEVTAQVVDHLVTLEVRDHGSWQVKSRRPGGYGLLLMTQFMHRVDVDRVDGDGTTVTLQRELGV